MNKQFIAALFSVAAIFTACENDETMGTDLMPSTDRPGIVVTDTIDIKAETLIDDSVYSSYQSHLLVGRLNDPVFGTTEAAFCAKFSNTSYGKFPNDAICDSVILSLGLDSTITHFYGDLNNPGKINVFRLTQPFSSDSLYFSNYNYKQKTADEPLCSAEFNTNDNTKEIKFSLPLDYGNEIMRCTRDTTFDANLFGLCFAPDETSACVTKTSQSNNNIKYVVYYHQEGDTASTGVTFSIANSNPRASFFNHDYSGSNIFDNNGDSLLYLQSMAGSKIKLDFKDVDKFNYLPHKYFALLRAQLIIPIADSTSGYQPINELICFGNNREDGKLIQFPEFFTKNSRTGETVYLNIPYDKNNRRYTVNLTVRVIDLIKTYKIGGEPSYDIFIYPNARTSDFCRSIVSAPNKKDTPLKLVVQYTVFDK